jgi:hypothetical protein
MLYKVKLEGAHSGYIIVEWRVNMPGQGETITVGWRKTMVEGRPS